MAISYRLGTPSNLAVSGTYDLLLIKYPDGYPQGQLLFNIDETPRLITGVQKVAQLFIKLLFTSKGSNVILPLQGTNFSGMVINSNVQTTDTLFIASVREQIQDAEAQTKYILNTGTDLSSQLDSISFIGLDGVKDSVTVYLQMLTLAGVNAQIAVPFPQLSLSLSTQS